MDGARVIDLVAVRTAYQCTRRSILPDLLDDQVACLRAGAEPLWNVDVFEEGLRIVDEVRTISLTSAGLHVVLARGNDVKARRRRRDLCSMRLRYRSRGVVEIEMGPVEDGGAIERIVAERENDADKS